jgi:DNA-binding CsgD family transcriptional regulator
VGVAAVAASQGKLNLAAVIVVTVVAGEAGGLGGYAIGRRWGRELLERPGRHQAGPEKTMKRGERLYARWGWLAVFFTPAVISGTAVQARIELARVHVALADMAGARTLLREADELLLQRPGLGNLVTEAEALRAELARQRESNALGASSLTDAELRLLPLLSTHLPVAEIAEEMRVSRRTIKSRAVSIYRKLGAASRSQAVSRARELGLLEG